MFNQILLKWRKPNEVLPVDDGLGYSLLAWAGLQYSEIISAGFSVYGVIICTISGLVQEGVPGNQFPVF